ncbi:MAG TPA: hypothetical protein VMQ62_03340, partial [Dongiaceae bacterium]|nr:hypothetical protein [Dongiaceae bacterium]
MNALRGAMGGVAALCLLSEAAGGVRQAPSFAERVRAQTVLERVQYAHQIGASRPFEEAVSQGLIERKVRNYLRKSLALERDFKTPVTGAMLDREAERIATGTRMPGRLREIYRALGNDPTLVRECFVRPILVDRLVRNFVGAENWDAWWTDAGARLDPGALVIPPQTATALPQPREGADPAMADLASAPLSSADLPSADRSSIQPAASGGCDPAGAWDDGALTIPPNGRYGHTAIWTGNTVIFWGGAENSGGRYDPLTDTWLPTSRINAP